MPRRLSSGLVVAVAVVSACSDRADQVPTDAPALASSPACDFKSIYDGVRAVFPTGLQTTVTAKVKDMEDACDAGNQTLETSLGLDVLRYVEDAFYSDALTGTPTQQATLVSDVLGKAALPVPEGALLVEVFSGGGAIGVRGASGDAYDANPVLSHENTVLWGVAPNPSFSGSTGNTEILIFGYPADDFTPESDFGTYYHFFRTPAVTFSPEVIIGACMEVADQVVVQKETTILNYTGVPSFCPVSSTMEPSNTLLRFAARMLLPRPLSATMLLQKGGSGGASTFSVSALINPGTTIAGFTTDGQPADGKVRPAFIKSASGGPIKIQVTAQQGTGIEDATVSVSAVNNNGNFVTLGGDTSEETDGTGLVIFDDLTLNKTGAYKLRAAISFTNPAIADVVVFSNKFNLTK